MPELKLSLSFAFFQIPTFERSPRSFQAVHFALPTKSKAPGFGSLHFPALAYINKDTIYVHSNVRIGYKG